MIFVTLGTQDKTFKRLLETIDKEIEKGNIKEKVIVHAKEGAFCLSKDGTFTKVGSLIIPKEMIKGSVGAGDAFCAGSLYASYNKYSDKEMLEFASGAAACSLFEANSVDGMKNKEEIKKVLAQFERRAI